MEEEEHCVTSEVSNMETDSENEEVQLQELRQLTAIIEADKSSLGSLPTSKEASELNNKIEKIDKAIKLNKLSFDKFCELETVLVGRLKECRERQKELRESITTNSGKEKQDKQNIFRYLTCGKPYFKDKDNFPAPDNDDTIMIKKAGMFDFSEITSIPGWTVKDKEQLLQQLTTKSRNIKKNQLTSEIAQLKRDSKVKNSKEIGKQVAVLKKRLSAVDKMPMSKKLALPLDEEYDWDDIATALNQRHSAQEYRSLWKTFLHPSINKKGWDRREHNKLQELAHLNGLQNWDKIAKELNTGRTPYQCFVYYRTNMGNAIGRKWTREEEEYLRRLIEYYKEDDHIPWSKVAACMENRTKIQIYNKYARLQEQRKGRFLPEEDAVLLTSVEHFGQNFKKIVKYLPGRSAAQLRVRYQVLHKNNTTKTSTVWKVNEDRKLIELMANQDSSFINYASLTEFFPDKTRAQLRARYSTLNKFMKKYPDKDISKAPRRGARHLDRGQSSKDLDKAIQKLKIRIQSEIDTKKSNRITRNSPDDVLDEAIIATLRKENEKKQEIQIWQSTDTEHIAQRSSTTVINDTNLRKLLTFLQSNLNKETFLDSSYANEYPSLLETERQTSVMNLKSYSRKQVTQNIEVGNFAPGVFGKTLKTSDYVLPPTYATITGLNKLLAYIGSQRTKQSSTMSMHYMMKRNPIFKEQVEIFIDRFKTLFMWPFLLSKINPPNYHSPKSPFKVSQEVQKKYKQQREKLHVVETQGEIVIPHTEEVCGTGQIDLDVSKQNEDLTLESHVGNDDFMYLDEAYIK
ncbi:snRNA-activating protein complex subunit 4-like [Pectinophora gossypiella]|uniref:snRNA-activating protein complex subunit 4-like n=1 Tax=Pectinophora gossypiella TaxID=13191 RepID=UPI00214ECD68|nr:snRNA-activating protein complex subunit 4-like [Pectinophora gossypiella]